MLSFPWPISIKPFTIVIPDHSPAVVVTVVGTDGSPTRVSPRDNDLMPGVRKAA